MVDRQMYAETIHVITQSNKDMLNEVINHVRKM